MRLYTIRFHLDWLGTVYYGETIKAAETAEELFAFCITYLNRNYLAHDLIDIRVVHSSAI